MNSLKEIEKEIFNLDRADLERLAMEVFHLQAKENAIYRAYLELMGIDPLRVTAIGGIPFLPISFFKSQKVVSTRKAPDAIFESSGTTSQPKSKHYVADLHLYQRSIGHGFEHFYGDPGGYHFLALLPSYLDRQRASLVYMAHYLMSRSARPDNGFYLSDHEALVAQLAKLEEGQRPAILLGVTFALLQLAENFSLQLNNTIIMETGGMKGHGRELTRMEVHNELTKAFGTPVIHSEYGMTELLSQAYSKGQGRFATPPWMKVFCRDINDPFERLAPGQPGIIQVIDLANLYSCSFIETADLGRVYEDGTFEVLGRADNSDVRGCNLML